MRSARAIFLFAAIFLLATNAFVRSVPADDVLQVLADGARSEDLACAYLFHLGYNAVLRSGVRPGSRVLVIGLGVLGLTSVAMAAIAGARVVAVSGHALPQRLGLEFGASAVLARSDGGAIRSALSDLWLCSPRTQEMASTILDLPQPLGPMMQVSPLPLKVICVFSQNDLKPTSSTLRSLSKISPLWPMPCMRWVVRLSKIAYTNPNAYTSAETYSA